MVTPLAELSLGVQDTQPKQTTSVRSKIPIPTASMTLAGL
jgi:hypothetical protein